MTAAVEILSGELIGRSYAIDESPFAIGRKEDCAIVIPKKYFSRRHAEIVRRGDAFAIRGLSAKNPIYVNAAEVQESPLRDGDEFEICGVRFRFRAEGRGQTRAERAIERASGTHAALAARSTGRGGDDDDLLDGDENTENRRGGMSDLDDGELPDDVGVGSGSGGGAARTSRADDVEDGPLPGEDGDGERFEFGGPAKKSGSAGGKVDVRATAQGSGAERAGMGAAAKESLRADGAPGWKPEPEKGPRERVVFAVDDAAAQKKSKASGPNAADDDKDERTDQIDISKLKKDDDPFAASAKKNAAKDPAAIAAREKFLKVLVAVGTAGICLAAGIIWKINQPPPVKPVFNITLEPATAVNETRLYNQPLNEDDPPDVDRRTPLTGEPTNIVDVSDPTIARVEWAIPDMPRVAYLLVTGITEGTTKFLLKSKSGVSTIYTINIRGTSPHDLNKKKRQDGLTKLSEDELKRRIDKHLSAAKQLGDQLERTGRPEDYVRQILHECELADEELNALAKLVDSTGVTDPTLPDRRDAVRAALDAAHQSWDSQLDHGRKNYVDYVKRGDWAPASVQLKALCGILGDHCGAEFQRYMLLLDKKYQPAGYYNGNFKDPGCIEAEAPE